MKWSDEYWPLLVKEYKRKPEGVKALYSKNMVELALRLHIQPQELHRKLMELRKIESPQLQKLWDDLSSNTRKLNKAVKVLLEKEGYGTSGRFFDGIAVNESWELDFRPVEDDSPLMPVHLILILDLYFQLTPTTMVSDTEEIQDLARLIKLPVSLVLEVMEGFKHCDPYISLVQSETPLIPHCKAIWNRFGNDDIEKLSSLAEQLKKYF